jgi:GNAT superfamily N-acetyltransferase
MEICFASLEDIIPLRQQMIIQGTDRDTPYFPGDQNADTRHVAIFDDGCCIGCATLMATSWEGHPAYQMRGMATALDRQRQGLGTALLKYCEQRIAAETGVRLLWCNARVIAVGFYEKNGWRIVSGQFEIPGVGMHYKMLRDLRGEG